MYFTCYITESAVGSFFGPESPTPHTTTIYYPDSTIAASYTDAGNYLTYPTWPHPGTITVVQQDGCGYKDTTQLFQPDLLPTRTISFRGGCPGINGNSGGADLVFIWQCRCLRWPRKWCSCCNRCYHFQRWSTGNYSTELYHLERRH